jgi:hypothetical protein
MKLTLPLALLAAALASTSVICAADAAADREGFVPLFNGRDLTGWTNVNCAPETWGVKDSKIVCTGVPIGALRTTRQYENFIVEFEWRHLTSGGNSGMFVWASPINAPGVPFLRGIEVQALDHGYAIQYEQKTGKKPDFFTTHGDVFPIHGATMKTIGRTNGRRSFPTEDRSKPSPEWNHYRIVGNNGSLRLHVNGKEVSGGDDCNYRKGYLALESEGAPVEFRNLRIKELPSTGATAEVTAPLDPGWRSLFNGVDLRGWRVSSATAARWSVAKEKLTLMPAVATSAEKAATGATLWTTEEFADAEFVIDYEAPKSTAGQPIAAAVLFVRGRDGRGAPVRLVPIESGKFTRFIVTVQGRTLRVQAGAATPQELSLPVDVPARGVIGFEASAGAAVFMNLHARDLR